jgi:hypothetical protein
MPPVVDYEALLKEDARKEVRIFWSEIAVIAFLAILTLAYFIVRQATFR